MTRLSACYFCGTALDESLDDYPVVPAPLRGDAADPTRVTLCPACHEKLDAILERVTAAAETTDSPAGGPGAASSTDSATEAGDDADDSAPTVAGDEPLVSDRSKQGASAPDSESRTTTAESTDPAGEPASGHEPESAGDSSAVPGAGEPEAESGGDAAGEPDQGDEDGEDAGERSVVEGKHDISALEYNKVMRLLQNREFPVDRAEIEMVAANAYQVGRADCEEVIDVAIDRGLIAEVDGELRKPENV